jgi:hypothetical protein
MLISDGGMAPFGTVEASFASPDLPVAIEFPCV